MSVRRHISRGQFLDSKIVKSNLMTIAQLHRHGVDITSTAYHMHILKSYALPLSYCMHILVSYTMDTYS